LLRPARIQHRGPRPGREKRVTWSALVVFTSCASTAITAEYANIFDAYAGRIGQIRLRDSTACRIVRARVIAFGSTSGSAVAERNSDDGVTSAD
jgi:hypothetical protein